MFHSSPAQFKAEQSNDKFTNIFANRDRIFDDLLFTFQQWSCDPPEVNNRRTPQQIQQHILDSQRVKHTIHELTKESGNEAELWKEAEETLKEIGHNYGLGTIRIFAYVLSKLAKKFYSAVYVNDEGIEQVRKVMKDYPVVLLPCHRSYVDFLLLSFVNYHFRLQLPLTAAGKDLMDMKFVSEGLRGGGGFFMRRSFGKDKLYWALFTEYLQDQLLSLEAPLEFYIEGGRSRVGKSLAPKYGLLTKILEPYFTGRTSDVYLVPISICYDRTLEENLYSYEALGASKPKESLRSLLQALTVMNETYGSLHVNIGKPISVHEFCEGKLTRNIHTIGPYWKQELVREEKALVQELGYKVVKSTAKNQVVSPFDLIATTLKTSLSHSLQTNEITFSQLVEEASYMKSVFENVGAYVHSNGHREEIQVAFETHKSLLQLSEDNKVTLIPAKENKSTERIQKKGFSLSSDVLSYAIPHVTLQQYVNKCIHFVVPLCILKVSIPHDTIQINSDNLFTKFSFLSKLFSYDFLFEPGKEKEDYANALKSSLDLNVITSNGTNEFILSGNKRLHCILEQLILPYFITYRSLCWIVEMSDRDHMNESDILKETQKHIEILIMSGMYQAYSSLSLDTIKNALKSFTIFGVLNRIKRAENVYLKLNKSVAKDIGKKIDEEVEWPENILQQLKCFTKNTQAKL